MLSHVQIPGIAVPLEPSRRGPIAQGPRPNVLTDVGPPFIAACDSGQFGLLGAGGKLPVVAEGDQVLTVADVSGWSQWLTEHGGKGSSVWLVLAKKGTTKPTNLTYDEALEEAICHGWIDGQLAKGDDRTYRRRFAPRRAGSAWSKRNVDLAKRLVEKGRMRPSGLASIDRAKADGSWDRAYEGQATIQMPPDLASALATNREAEARFERLSASNRYAILYRVTTAKRSETRQRRIEQLVAMLARGETIHPQR